jgi:hypothetical protein
MQKRQMRNLGLTKPASMELPASTVSVPDPRPVLCYTARCLIAGPPGKSVLFTFAASAGPLVLS